MWRHARRIEGLADEEFLWEPAPDAWTVRTDPSGGRTSSVEGALRGREPTEATIRAGALR